MTTTLTPSQTEAIPGGAEVLALDAAVRNMKNGTASPAEIMLAERAGLSGPNLDRRATELQSIAKRQADAGTSKEYQATVKALEAAKAAHAAGSPRIEAAIRELERQITSERAKLDKLVSAQTEAAADLQFRNDARTWLRRMAPKPFLAAVAAAESAARDPYRAELHKLNKAIHGHEQWSKKSMNEAEAAQHAEFTGESLAQTKQRWADDARRATARLAEIDAAIGKQLAETRRLIDFYIPQ